MLNKEQKRFIERRVENLGSIKKVKAFYKRKSLVTKYAYQYANKIYNEKNKK